MDINKYELVVFIDNKVQKQWQSSRLLVADIPKCE